MSVVKSGDSVRIHYTGTLSDGSVFDSSEGREPLEFTAGSGQIIPGLDKEVMGMSEGESKTVTIPHTEAYGPVHPDAQQSVPRSEIPAEIDVQPGLRLQMQAPQGQTIPVVVTHVSEDSVTLDANHPLAGQDLTFKFEVVSVADGAS